MGGMILKSLSSAKFGIWGGKAIVMAKMGRNADLQIITGNIDRDFAILMIQHHQAATEMADLEIHYGKDSKIIELARRMIEDQEMEIRELQIWLLK